MTEKEFAQVKEMYELCKDDLVEQYSVKMYFYLNRNDLMTKPSINKHSKILATAIAHFASGHKATLEEMKQLTGIPAKTIQKYLCEKDFLTEVLGEEFYKDIRSGVRQNRIESPAKAKSAYLHQLTFNANGKLSGKRKR